MTRLRPSRRNVVAGFAALAASVLPTRAFAQSNACYQGPPSDHFDGTRFFYPGSRDEDRGLADGLLWQLGSRAASNLPGPAPNTTGGKSVPRLVCRSREFPCSGRRLEYPPRSGLVGARQPVGVCGSGSTHSARHRIRSSAADRRGPCQPQSLRPPGPSQGDTGFGDGSTFREVARAHPQLWLALLPVDAYVGAGS